MLSLTTNSKKLYSSSFIENTDNIKCSLFNKNDDIENDNCNKNESLDIEQIDKLIKERNNRKNYYSKSFNKVYIPLSFIQKVKEFQNMEQKSTKRFETYSNIFESIKREINDINYNISFLSNSSSKKKISNSSSKKKRKHNLKKSISNSSKKLFHTKNKKLQIIVDDIEEKDEEYIISPNKSIHKRGNSQVIDFQITNFISNKTKDDNNVNNNSLKKIEINKENINNIKNNNHRNNNNTNISTDFNEINEGKNKIILTTSSKKESLSNIKIKMKNEVSRRKQLLEEKRKLFFKKNNVNNNKHTLIAENVEVNRPCCHCQFQ